VPEYSAVVVGSGPNGLTAAVELARNGAGVLVVEAADRVGGGASSEELTRRGFVHDVCSAIHPLGIGSPVFASLPLGEHGLQWVHPGNPLAHPLDDGSAAVLARSIESTAATLDGDGDAYSRLMNPLVGHWEQIRRHVLGPVVRLPRSPVALGRFGMRAVLPASRLARRFEGTRARALIGGLAAHSIAPLNRPLTSGVALTLGIAGHAVGWPMARGGSQSISDALASLLRNLGGEIQTGHRVAGLDELPSATVYLLDTAPAAAVAIAGDRLPARSRRMLQRFEHGPGTFKVDWALRGPIPWANEQVATAGTVHLGGTFEEIGAAEGAVMAGDHPRRPFVLLAQQSLFDPTRAPQGRHTAWAYCHVPAGSTVDMTRRIEDQVERFAPGFRDQILARSTLSPADLEARNANLVGGDVGGGAATVRQLVLRPGLTSDPYRIGDRVFLCSASTPPGAGVHGMCGYHAARSALRRLSRGG